MNIFITGGAGYIGSATAEALLWEGHTVTVYDSLVTGHRAAVPKGARFIEAALEDHRSLSKALTTQQFDAVMHFAAFIEAGELMKDPGRFYFNNLANSLSLIEMAVLAGVKRFVFSSTAAVYQSSDEPLTEEFAARPDERLRAHQADGGADPGLVSPDPRLAFRGPALLQRLRRAARARGGAPARIASHPAGAARCAGPERSRLPSSAPIIRRPTAPASAITSISRTWYRHICWPSKPSAQLTD